MKKTFISAFFSIALATGFAQTYNSPESIEFDYSNNRWFVANNGGNNVLTRNSTNGALAVFASGFTTGPHGLEIVNDTLYVCDGSNLKAYNKNTGASVFNINLGATFLNGITHDNSGNLYVTDFTGKKIYRFSIASRLFNLFCSTGTKTPNGIIYDQPNNRCVFVTWNTNAAIMQVNLADSTVSQVVVTTLSSCDGIAKDGIGNYYVSSWGLNGITRFTNSFTSPTTVVTGLSSPADIFYNTVTDTLGVPNAGTSGANANKPTFHYFGSPTGIVELTNTQTFTVFPNPVSNTATINIELTENQKVTISLYDEKGALLKMIQDGELPKGKNTLFMSRNGLAAGTYFIKLNTSTGTKAQKIVITE